MMTQNYLTGSKVYVDVTEEYISDGVVPRSFVWEDGTHYDVDKILCIYPSEILKASNFKYRYTIRIGERKTFMYLEDDNG